MRNERNRHLPQRLLDEVWGYDPSRPTNTIEVFVSNLRRKLEAADGHASSTRSVEQGTFSEHRGGRTRTPLSRLSDPPQACRQRWRGDVLMLAVFGPRRAHTDRSPPAVGPQQPGATDAQNFANELHITYVGGQLVVPVRT